MATKKLTKENLKEIEYLYSHRIPMAHIAKYIGVTLPTIRNQVLINRFDKLSIPEILLEAQQPLLPSIGTELSSEAL